VRPDLTGRWKRKKRKKNIYKDERDAKDPNAGDVR
jgi:hypothetical protein